MVTDYERREVAERMRRAAARDEYEELDFRHALESCMFGGITCSPRGALFACLADLIDRPTCVNVYDGREFQCSECGMQWHLLDRGDVFEQWAHVRTPRYCLECGAEVAK